MVALSDRVAAQAERRIVVRPGMSFNGVKVFSATKFADREQLGDRVTRWILRRADAAPRGADRDE